MSYSQVINKAREIRDLYFSPDYPLQTAFKKIFEDNNISILFQENGEMLKKVGNNSYIISLPLNTSPLRDNYTIAHELGHFFLGHPLNEEYEIHRSLENNRIEREANIFAAELLMPKDQFIDACNKCNNDPYAVASIFSVSPSAAAVRMSTLKIV